MDYNHPKDERDSLQLPPFMDTSVLVFCLYHSQAPHCCLLLLLDLGAPLMTMKAQLFFECGTRPLSLGSLPLLPSLSERCCFLSWFKSFKAPEELKQSRTPCYSRSEKIRLQDLYLHDFLFVLEPIGCMQVVGQSGQPSHH